VRHENVNGAAIIQIRASFFGSFESAAKRGLKHGSDLCLVEELLQIGLGFLGGHDYCLARWRWQPINKL
jgi:hypothetical protein